MPYTPALNIVKAAAATPDIEATEITDIRSLKVGDWLTVFYPGSGTEWPIRAHRIIEKTPTSVIITQRVWDGEYNYFRSVPRKLRLQELTLAGKKRYYLSNKSANLTFYRYMTWPQLCDIIPASAIA